MRALLLIALVALIASVHASNLETTETAPTTTTTTSTATCKYECENGGTCTNGKCECAAGYVGFDCSSRGCGDLCSHNGWCYLGVNAPSCICKPGFSGTKCEVNEVAAAAAKASAKAAVLSSFKSKGKKSSKPCTAGCDSVNGRCVNGVCFCKTGSFGPTCSSLLCPNNCGGKGECDTTSGTCDCHAPYSGAACELKTIPTSSS